ncbi:MAG: response regulator [Campylobacterota bacterium]|nr:response regulator [Campylobacterota bacterium]
MNDIVELRTLAKDYHVLFVDDDCAISETIERYLKKIFPQVTMAENGAVGLEIYKEKAIDIVISDISMPVMNGIEMIREMKKIDEMQEIIIVSAFSDFKYLSDAISLGVSGYLLKPVDYDTMTRELFKSVYKLHVIDENRRYQNELELMVQEKIKNIEILKEEKVENYDKTLLSLIEMIESRDTYTAGHSQRVAEYSLLIAQSMGYDEPTCKLLYKAGILHDIGKIATPDSILLNPRKLNTIEYTLIKEHVNTGYQLLHNIPMFEEISEIIRHHHEHCDGSGYPNGLMGDAIPPLSRIMIVADAFDAMTTNRIYKGRKSVEDALKEIEELSGKQFHPEVAEIAIKVLKDIKIDHHIDQLPTNELEKERFAYFYRDQITDAYNVDYLDFILSRNVFTQEYRCINALYIHNFSHYNDKHGWAEGNKLLHLFSEYLNTHYPQSLVFRFHGDDFIIISKEHLEVDMNQFEYFPLFKKDRINVSKLHVDLGKQKISNLVELEVLV